MARPTVHQFAAILALSMAAAAAVAGGFADAPTSRQMTLMITTGVLTAAGMALVELSGNRQLDLVPSTHGAHANSIQKNSVEFL